jgi:hypothetical protein
MMLDGYRNESRSDPIGDLQTFTMPILIGITLVGNRQLENSGQISAYNKLGDAYGVELVHGNLTNHSTGIIKAESTGGNAWALMLSDSKAVNNGTILGDTILENGSILS